MTDANALYLEAKLIFKKFISMFQWWTKSEKPKISVAWDNDNKVFLNDN